MTITTEVTKKHQMTPLQTVILLGVASALLQLLCVFLIPGFIGDLNCNYDFGNYIFENGLGHYINVDYPPLGIYFFTLCTGICRLLHTNTYWQYFIFRLPTIIIAFFNVLLFYSILLRFSTKTRKNIFYTTIFAFAPAIFINIIWGQTDLLIMFFILLTIYLFLKQKYLGCMITGTLGLLTKYQFIFILPVLGWALIYHFYKQKKLKILGRNLLICLAIWLTAYFPLHFKLIFNGEWDKIIDGLTGMVTHYQEFSCKAFNFYFCLNLNFVKYPVWYRYINFLIIAVISLTSIILYTKCPTARQFIFLITFQYTSVFMFSTNMHERYLLPILGGIILTAAIANHNYLKITALIFYIAVFVNQIVILNGGFWHYDLFILNFTQREIYLCGLMSLAAWLLLITGIISMTNSLQKKQDDV